MRRALFFVVMLVPAMVWSQSQQSPPGRFDLTLNVGYRWGGDMLVEERAVHPGDYTTDVTSSGAFGLRLGFALTNAIRLELMADRQNTRFMDDQGLFGEEPGSFVPPGDTTILDVDITYYQLGVTGNLTSGSTQWYLAGSAGVTSICPNLPLPHDTAFSVGVGGGVRLEMTPRLWVLFEARVFWVDTDEDLSGTVEFENQDCGDTCYITFSYDDYFIQEELSLGILFRF